MNRKLVIAGIITMLVVMVVVYFSKALFNPSDTIMTNHLATDLYGHYLHAIERFNLLKSGFMPFGDYWVNRGGGFPAASNEQLIAQHEFMLMIGYIFTGNIYLVHKVLVVLLYIATALLSFWYGRLLFKRNDASLVLSVAYTFSTYGINQLEHLELIGIQPFILLVLICVEKVLSDLKNNKYIILGSVAVFWMFLSSLYGLYFLVVYLIFRVVSALLVQKEQKREIIVSMAKMAGLALLLCLPLFIPQMLQLPNKELQEALKDASGSYSRQFSYFFYRNTPYQPYFTEAYFLYIGISVFILAMLPMLFKKHTEYRSLFIYNIIVVMVCILFSVGKIGNINLSKLLPYSYFIQVPSRIMMVGSLGMAVCAAIGFMMVADRINVEWRKAAFAVATAIIIFIDLSVGFMPHTMPEYFKDNSIYQYIRSDRSEFRVVSVPSIHDQMAATEIITGKDYISQVVWAYGHFTPLKAFAKVYDNYTNLQETASDAALYGVKYVVVNLDPEYYETFKKAVVAINTIGYDNTTKVKEMLDNDHSYKLVLTDGKQYVYENLLFNGEVFADNANIQYYRDNNDRMRIFVNAKQQTTVTISQSFAAGWKAYLVDGKDRKPIPIKEYKSVSQIEVPQGLSTIEMVYTRHTQSLVYILGFWVVWLAIVIMMRLK